MADKKLMAAPAEQLAAKEECDLCIACMACGVTPTPDIEVAGLAAIASLFAIQ